MMGNLAIPEQPGEQRQGVLRQHGVNVSVAAKKGTSLAVEPEPGVGLRSGQRWAQACRRVNCFPLSGRIVFGFDQRGAVGLTFDLVRGVSQGPVRVSSVVAFCMHAARRAAVNYRVGTFVRVPERFRRPTL
jgi:hypothetical protein